MSNRRAYVKCIVLGVAAGVALIVMDGGDIRDVAASAPLMLVGAVGGVAIGVTLLWLRNRFWSR